MIRSLVDFLWGKVVLRIEQDAERALTILMCYNIPFRSIRKDGSSVFITLSRRDAKRAASILSLSCIRTSVVLEKGIQKLLPAIAKRPGIIAGTAILIIVVYLSTLFIWDMKITGNEKLSDTQISEILASNGCCVGAYLPSLDLWSICNSVVMHSEDISWISVNMDGTTANVEVRELRKSDDMGKREGEISMLVASRDGQVVRYEVGSGIVCVDVGQTVAKGDLLVSGAVENEKVSYLTSAEGKVYASTIRFFSVFCPSTVTVKNVTGKNTVKKSVKIFQKEIILLNKGSNLSGMYDIISDEYRPTIFESIILPVTVHRTSAVFYTEEQIALDEGEMARRAEDMLASAIAFELGDAQILSVTRKETSDGNGYTIDCTVSAIENIAEKVYIGKEQKTQKHGETND